MLFYKWPAFVDAKGSASTASITEKRESVRERFGSWFRRFEIVAAFRAPGSPLVRHTICDVDQAAYESLHVGDGVEIHFFPALLEQPFVPAAHLAPCTFLANFGSNPDQYRRMEIVFGSLGAILLVWLILRIRIAGWLLAPWFGFFLAYGVAPRAEPAPTRPVPARAAIRSLATVDTIIGGHAGGTQYDQPIKLEHPYQLVQLEFTPAGANGPVVAVDAVDVNSISNLAPRQIVEIDYDAANPRIARIRGGTRFFPEQALHELMLIYAVLLGLPAALFLFGRRRLRRTAPPNAPIE